MTDEQFQQLLDSMSMNDERYQHLLEILARQAARSQKAEERMVEVIEKLASTIWKSVTAFFSALVAGGSVTLFIFGYIEVSWMALAIGVSFYPHLKPGLEFFIKRVGVGNESSRSAGQ